MPSTSCAPRRSGSCGSRRPAIPCLPDWTLSSHDNGGAPAGTPPPRRTGSAWLGAGDVNLERLVHRLHGVGHVDTVRGARDLVRAAVLRGLGFTLARSGLVAQRHAVDVAEANRVDGRAVLAEHRSDTGGGVADRNVHVSAHRTAYDGARHVLILAIDHDLGAAPAGCCCRAHRCGSGCTGGCRRAGALGLLLTRRTA